MLAGAALVFLTAIKELPATLLLRPIGFETLATEIWRANGGRRVLEVALPALAPDRRSPLPVLWLLLGAGAADRRGRRQ